MTMTLALHRTVEGKTDFGHLHLNLQGLAIHENLNPKRKTLYMEPSLAIDHNLKYCFYPFIKVNGLIYL